MFPVPYGDADTIDVDKNTDNLRSAMFANH